MKIKIAVEVFTNFSCGGSFQYSSAALEALAGLDKERFEVQVWYEDTSWKTFLASLSLQGHSMSTLELPPNIQKIVKLVQSAEQEGRASPEQKKQLNELVEYQIHKESIEFFKPDIIFFPQMHSRTYMQEAKHLGVIHDLMHRYEARFPEVSENGEKEFRDKLFSTMVSHCEKIFVDSEIGAQHVLDCYPNATKEQLVVLPFAASRTITILKPQKPKSKLPEKFFFYPAQFWKHKNHVGLALALARLYKTYPEIHFVLSGTSDKNGYEDFLKLIKEAGIEDNFTYLGYVGDEELVWLYKNARAMIMPTFFGPTNIPPLEAMALECPVAVSGIYGMPEAYGSAALYFNPEDIDEIADTMEQLWTNDDLCSELKRKGLERVAQYTYADFIGKLQDTFEKVALNA